MGVGRTAKFLFRIGYYKNTVLTQERSKLGVTKNRWGKGKVIGIWGGGIEDKTSEINNAKDYSNLGLTHVKEGKVDEAINAYKKAIEINPNYAVAHSDLGNVYVMKGELDKAIEAYKEAIKINPDYAEAYINLALAYADKGELSEAMNAYNKGIEINPDLKKSAFFRLFGSMRKWLSS